MAILIREAATFRSVGVMSRVSLSRLSVILALLAAGRCVGAEPAEFLSNTVTLNIPAQRVETALLALSKQTHIQVIISPESSHMANSPGVIGSISVGAALDRLLQDTGLRYFKVGNSITVTRVSNFAEAYYVNEPARGTRVDTANRQGARLPVAALRANRADDDQPGTNGAESAPDGRGKRQDRIEEVIVTAQKRTENLQDVPVAVAVVGQDSIKALGAKTLNDIAATVPGLFLAQSGGFGDGAIIRGISSSGGDAATVGYYINDVPIHKRTYPGLAGTANPELYDLERVEVLRGPQGTLYGASAMGGMIRFITPQPSLHDTSGRMTTEVSATDGGAPSFNTGVALGTPIVDGVLGFRGSAYFREEGGYIDRIAPTTERDVNSARVAQAQLALLWQVSPGLSISPSFLYQAGHNDDISSFLETYRPKLEQNFIAQPGHDNFYVPSLKIAYDFGAATLESITTYYSRDQAQTFDYGTLFPSFGATVPSNYIAYAVRSNLQHVFSEELRLLSPSGGRFQWLLGAYYTRLHQEFHMPIIERPGAAFGGVELPGDVSYRNDTFETDNQIALFGEATYELVRNLKLTAGVRVGHSRFNIHQELDGPLAGGPQGSSGSERSSSVTPKAGLSYNFTPDVMVYTSATKGFRDGTSQTPVLAISDACQAELDQVNNTSLAPKPMYGPDSVWSYELGLKSQAFERRLRANVSLFRINWSNIQSSVNLPECGNGYTTNFGSARSQGVELDISAVPIPGLELAANATYTDAKFTSDVLFRDVTTGQESDFALKGDPIVGLHWTGSLSATYNFVMTANMNGYIRGNYQYVGSRPLQRKLGRVGYDPAFASLYGRDYPAYSYGSARFGIIRNNLDLSLFVNNIANAQPRLSLVNIALTSAETEIGSTLRPRVIGVTAELRF